jgi:hypothetical protein
MADFSMASTDAFLRLTLLLYCSTCHQKSQGMSCEQHSIITGHTSLPTDCNNDSFEFVKSVISLCTGIMHRETICSKKIPTEKERNNEHISNSYWSTSVLYFTKLLLMQNNIL